jgi:hypothetical protein
VPDNGLTAEVNFGAGSSNGFGSQMSDYVVLSAKSDAAGSLIKVSAT